MSSLAANQKIAKEFKPLQCRARLRIYTSSNRSLRHASLVALESLAMDLPQAPSNGAWRQLQAWPRSGWCAHRRSGRARKSGGSPPAPPIASCGLCGVEAQRAHVRIHDVDGRHQWETGCNMSDGAGHTASVRGHGASPSPFTSAKNVFLFLGVFVLDCGFGLFALLRALFGVRSGAGLAAARTGVFAANRLDARVATAGVPFPFFGFIKTNAPTPNSNTTTAATMRVLF